MCKGLGSTPRTANILLKSEKINNKCEEIKAERRGKRGGMKEGEEGEGQVSQSSLAPRSPAALYPDLGPGKAPQPLTVTFLPSGSWFIPLGLVSLDSPLVCHFQEVKCQAEVSDSVRSQAVDLCLSGLTGPS